MREGQQFTADSLRAVATDELGMYVIHRHAGQEHDPGETCWCYPLVLTHEQITGMGRNALRALLDEHYRRH